MKKLKQGEFKFLKWGGARKGAGRKPKGERAGVSHMTRAKLASKHPVHVTLRLVKGLPGLRNVTTYEVLREAFRKGRERFGFRLVQYSVQGNHMHLIVEAKDRRALSRGMQGLLVRVARALNKLWKRRGRVLGDRYHDHVLKTPSEVRNALAYVLFNIRRHGGAVKRQPDYYSSGLWFDGWKQDVTITGLARWLRPIAHAHTWLLQKGWRKRGLISITEVPGGR